MIGAIIGDVVGSRFEFSNILSKEFALLTEENCFTDDTVMTCAVAQALMESREDYSDLPEKTVEVMQRIGRHYPDCGYGGSFYGWMFSDHPKPYNSYGNGSAMRVSAAGFAAKDIEEAKRLAHAVTAVSHNHPEGLKGAEATAVAIVMARQGCTKDRIIEEMRKYYELDTSLAKYRRRCCGHGEEICQVTMPQALRCFMEGQSYVDVIRNCISIGGDSDTIAAIAGGIAEAYYGVPEELKLAMRKYLTPELWNIILDFETWLRNRKKEQKEEDRMELKGLDLIKACRERPDAFLPMVEIKEEIPGVIHYDDGYKEYNIGWYAGILEGNRPFLAMCWAAEQVTFLSMYVSEKGIEHITGEELDRMFIENGYYNYKGGENYSPRLSLCMDPQGNRFHLLTITVGIDCDPALINGAPLFPYSELNEYIRKTREDFPLGKEA